MKLSTFRVREGECVSWWLGRAWSDYVTNSIVVLPIGLHWIAGAARFCWYEFRVGFRGQALLDQAYRDGERAGVARGIELAKADARAEAHARIREGRNKAYAQGWDDAIADLFKRITPTQGGH